MFEWLKDKIQYWQFKKKWGLKTENDIIPFALWKLISIHRANGMNSRWIWIEISRCVNAVEDVSAEYKELVLKLAWHWIDKPELTENQVKSLLKEASK
jgi:hypothetical protein